MKSNLKLVEINMSSLSEFEQRSLDVETSSDPLELYIQKIESLAELLDCSEEVAERIILGRVQNITVTQ